MSEAATVMSVPAPRTVIKGSDVGNKSWKTTLRDVLVKVAPDVAAEETTKFTLSHMTMRDADGNGRLTRVLNLTRYTRGDWFTGIAPLRNVESAEECASAINGALANMEANISGVLERIGSRVDIEQALKTEREQRKVLEGQIAEMRAMMDQLMEQRTTPTAEAKKK